MRSNKVENSTATGMYSTTHDVKVTFRMPEFSSSKIINHRFHFDNKKGELVIGYELIIGRSLMVQLGLTAKFKRQVLQWDGATVHMKEPIVLIGKSNLTKRKICEVVIQTTEPASTREASDQMVKILNGTYEKADLNQVADDATQLNSEERTLFLSILEDFEDLFEVTLGDQANYPVNLDIKPGSKPFNSRSYLVPRINKELFRKELKRLV